MSLEDKLQRQLDITAIRDPRGRDTFGGWNEVQAADVSFACANIQVSVVESVEHFRTEL